MLPYFSFPKPPDTETGLFAYSDSFLEQTRGALIIMADWWKKLSKTFDQLYVVGWDPLIQLKHLLRVVLIKIIPLYFLKFFLSCIKIYEDKLIDEGIFI